MIDLTKKVLPDSIIVDGKTFRIHTDFTYWLNFADDLSDKNKTVGEFDYLYIDEKPENRLKGFQALIDFYLDKRVLPRPIDTGRSGKSFDFKIDADLIYAAFIQQYHIDLLEQKDFHWWKFQALFFSLTKETKFQEVLGFRSYDPNDKTEYKKFMKQMQEIWKLEDEEDKEAAKVLEAFNKL